MDRRVRTRAALTRLFLVAALTAACGPVAAVPSPSVTGGPPSLAPAATGSGPAASGPRSMEPATPGPDPVGSASPVPTATGGGMPAASATVKPTAGPTARPTVPPGPTPRITPRPTVTPRPTATTRPTARPTPTRPAASRLLSHGSRTSRGIALTFDMGGRVGDALAIVDWLIAHGVHASIFMTGAMADNEATDAGRRVLALIDGHPGLLTLGNHSYSHRDFRTLTEARIRDELRRTEAAIAPWCSQDPKPFFRPPSGGYDADVLAAVGAAGYRDTVTWDVDTIDWRPVVNDPPGPTADQIVAKVLSNARGGSIVLMHLGGYETLDALPRIVAGLTDAGFDLVTLDRMSPG